MLELTMAVGAIAVEVDPDAAPAVLVAWPATSPAWTHIAKAVSLCSIIAVFDGVQSPRDARQYPAGIIPSLPRSSKRLKSQPP